MGEIHSATAFSVQCDSTRNDIQAGIRHVKIICLWSGPRNVSTALMYSFAQRPDTSVIDEPLYGHFLRVSGANHPGRAEVMESMNCDGGAVMDKLIDLPPDDPVEVLFLKQMAHHLMDIDREFLDRMDNVLLIRDPSEMLPSLTRNLPQAGLLDTGLAVQSQLYQDLVERGQKPAIVDSRELLLDPASVLMQLCQHLDLDFDVDMLSWPAGRREEDGIWEKHWYEAVHQSTGFAPHQAKSDFPDDLRELLNECQPYYDALYCNALRAERR